MGSMFFPDTKAQVLGNLYMLLAPTLNDPWPKLVSIPYQTDLGRHYFLLPLCIHIRREVLELWYVVSSMYFHSKSLVQASLIKSWKLR